VGEELFVAEDLEALDELRGELLVAARLEGERAREQDSPRPRRPAGSLLSRFRTSSNSWIERRSSRSAEEVAARADDQVFSAVSRSRASNSWYACWRAPDVLLAGAGLGEGRARGGQAVLDLGGEFAGLLDAEDDEPN
jgi:hypothetical protein